MDFQTYAAHELTALAERLADAAERQTEAATAELRVTYDANIDRLRADQSQLIVENERLMESRAALVERLFETFERIARSTSVDAVLMATAGGLIDAYHRVAVFVGGNRIVQLGAESPTIDPESASVMTLPITVRTDTIAVIYADDETHPSGEGAKLADLLRHHAMLALERLTTELKAVAELRAYARMLVDEVEYVFEADVNAKVSGGDRLERLKENLRCARQIYQQRVTNEGPAAASVLEDIIAGTVVAKADTPFGRELEALSAPRAPSSNSA